MENGTRDMQLDATLLMGKILIKMGSIKVDQSPSQNEMQEESKISDE
jgi:hypothetical protein